MLYKDPCVFAVEHEYQIAFNTTEFGIAWVEAGGQEYRDSRNGLMLSETLIHKVTVPMAVLDSAREYTVCFRALPERRPYFPELGPVEKKCYTFHPAVFSGETNVYMLADTHSRIDEPCRAASCFGSSLDMLILNGDIPAESKTPEDIRAIYDITSAITHGEIPVVFARGNHDYRGRLATELTNYIGTRNGSTFFTFRLGALWGIVLDSGEDKLDNHPEYGGLVDCHQMRLKETEFIQSVVENADEEFLAPGVEKRIVLSHVPFPSAEIDRENPVFNIERDIFSKWTDCLNQMHIDLMLSGHTHKLEVDIPGTDGMRFPANFPIVTGSAPLYNADAKNPYAGHEGAVFIGTALTFSPNGITAFSTDDKGGKAMMFSTDKHIS